MTIKELYLKALALLGESEAKATGYLEFAVPLTNQLLAQLFTTNNSILVSKGQTPLEKIPQLNLMDDEIPYDDHLSKECLPFGLASFFSLSEDRAKFNFYNYEFANRVGKFNVATQEVVGDVYA